MDGACKNKVGEWMVHVPRYLRAITHTSYSSKPSNFRYLPGYPRITSICWQYICRYYLGRNKLLNGACERDLLTHLTSCYYCHLHMFHPSW